MEVSEVNKVKVEIFGNTYTIKGDASPDYIIELADYINKKMEEVSANVINSNTVQIAILMALNIADEYFQLKKIKASAESVIGEKAKSLISMLDDGLIGDFFSGNISSS